MFEGTALILIFTNDGDRFIQWYNGVEGGDGVADKDFIWLDTCRA